MGRNSTRSGCGDGLLRDCRVGRARDDLLAPLISDLPRQPRSVGVIKMMKKLVFAAGVVSGTVLASGAFAADKVTIQLKWVTQAQFAGYYVAKAKGYYKDAGLDVTINPGGPDVAPPQVIAGGGADVIIDWMPSALASREKGVPLVNISQI